jgi:hypothetical protein
VVVQHALKPLLVTNPHIDEILTPPQAGSDGMRRPVSGRDAVGSQVIDALEAQTDKGDRQ